ncbi:MAG TPA: GrpB family protein [Methanospirillum sp.]|nr:GrpB family protein [Methanospirillum sp.]
MTPGRREIRIEAPNPQWQVGFEEIRNMIDRYIGDLVIRIEHVGSTAVPHLAAKPIIDLDVVIEGMDLLPEIIERLHAAGFEHEGDLGIAGREAFRRMYDDGCMPYHLYVCPKDGEELHRHILFRDHLRAHPDSREAYARLKRELSDADPHDIDKYCEGKGVFIRGILQNITGPG